MTSAAFSRHSHRWAWALTLALLVSGCVSKDRSDLESYVQQTLARPGGRIEPLPPIKPYQRYLYQSAELERRSPFDNYLDIKAEQPIATTSNNSEQRAYETEINTRNREELELVELDSLRMVGTLEDADALWGIIRDPDGTVHRVQVGNYLGRNHGKILDIEEDGIQLRELFKNTQGLWEERTAALSLSESE